MLSSICFVSMLNVPILDSTRVAPRQETLPKDADMLPPDYLSVASVLFAFAALYLNLRILGWAAFFSLLSSLLTKSNTEFDKAQTIIAAIVTFVVLCIVYADPNST